MEAETYLSKGYGMRLAIESKAKGWMQFERLARVWQPLRLKGIQVGPNVGTPFLAATQVFDLRPVPRKWLALARTHNAKGRFVERGTILVTCSGNVGRATLAFEPHLETLITHDLLRVEPREAKAWGWLYAFLRAPKTRAMMTGAKYGHIIKHLEVAHLHALPIPELDDRWLEHFAACAREIVTLRDKAHAATLDAEARFATALAGFKAGDNGEEGFILKSARSFFGAARRLDAWRHNPHARAILNHVAKGRATGLLVDCGYDVWVPGRYKRIPAEDGVAFLDSSDLFEINPDVAKRFADCRFGDDYRGRVKPGWLLMASSGQTYGLVGGAVLANDFYEGKVLANHVIRIVPQRHPKARPGYVLTALTHPTLGRPVVKSYAFGSSVPEISPEDVKRFPIVRLVTADEDAIADLAEKSAQLRAHADLLETEIADQAEAIIGDFISGNPIRRPA